MQSLPTELLHEIFTLACKDGGHTGRSLSLVSRFIHDAAEAVRYRSISVIGAAQCRGFASLLEHRAGHVSRPIHHLFISDLCDDSERMDEWRDDDPCAPRELNRLSCPVLVQILTAAAPQLRTLTLFHRGLATFRILPSATPFPLLAELTCFFGDGDATLSDAHAAAPTPVPALRRLHIIRSWPLLYPLNVAALAPALTHLRFSEEYAPLLDHDLPTYLLSLLGHPHSPSQWVKRQRPAAPLPPSVRRVVAHADTDRGVNVVRIQWHEEMIWDLVHIAKNDAAQRLRVLEDDLTMNRRLEAARADWLDRQEGGEGCWEIADVSVEEPHRCIYRQRASD